MKNKVIVSFSVLLILGLGFLAFYTYTTPDVSWYACQQDNECTANIVCDTNAINKKFTTKATMFNRLIEPFTSPMCEERDFGDKQNAFCKGTVCTDLRQTGPQDWIQCEKDSDCLTVHSKCESKAVSKKFSGVAQDYYTNLYRGMIVDCSEHPPRGDFLVTCEAKICTGRYREDKWYDCKTKEDCVTAFSGCGPKGVNKQYKEIFEEYYKDKNVIHGISCNQMLKGKFDIQCRGVFGCQ